MAATSSTLKKKVIYVCSTCGSEEVLLDAWASWNKDAQRWELANTFDAAYCAECEGECSVVTKAAN
jgi:hypothetical protein